MGEVELKLYTPSRPDPNLSFVDELAEKDEATGLIRRHVTWTQGDISEEEKARAILDLYWREERGLFCATNAGYYAHFKAWLNRTLDKIFGIRSPYERTTEHDDGNGASL